MYRKLYLFVCKFLVSCQVFEVMRHGVPYKAENGHAFSHNRYFSKHRLLDICRSAFNTPLHIFQKLHRLSSGAVL